MKAIQLAVSPELEIEYDSLQKKYLKSRAKKLVKKLTKEERDV